MNQHYFIYYPDNKSEIKVNVWEFNTHFVISEAYTTGMTLTNSIESAIEEMILYCAQLPCGNDFHLYQWCEGEGLFKLEWTLGNKIPRSMPPWTISNVKWNFFSKEFKPEVFETLYGKS